MESTAMDENECEEEKCEIRKWTTAIKTGRKVQQYCTWF